MSLALFTKELRSYAIPTLVVTAILAMYIACIAYMYDPEIAQSLDDLMDIMPELYAAFGMANPTDSMLDFLLNYLFGFLFTLMPLIIVMIAINRSIIRPIDRGSMAYLLATPASRLRISTTLALALIAVMALVMVAVVAIQIGCCETMFPGELDIPGLLAASAGLFALWLFMCGLCFACATIIPDTRIGFWAGGGLCVVMVLMQMVSQMGDGLSSLKRYNPIQLFDCYALAGGGAAASDAAVQACILGAMGIVLFCLGIAVFCRRDLSL